MAMVSADLADSMRSTMGFPTPVSAQLTGWATAVVNEIQQNGKVNNASGTVTGTCPPGGSLSSGAASGGVISGLDSSRLASAVASAAGYGSVSSVLSTYCSQIVTHVETGIVTFASGLITGTCSNTPLSPGPFIGSGSGGLISGLSGSTLASLIHSAVGYPGSVSGPLISFCTALCNYIMAQANCSYSGTCTGIAPAGGGSLSDGTGANGSIA